MCSKYVVLYIYSYRTVVRLYIYTHYTLTTHSKPLLTSTVSAHSSIVIPFSPWTHHSHLILFTPDPRSQIPRTTNSTASSYVHGLISFFYSDSLFTMDAPFTPHPVHTRSQIPDPTHHKFHSLFLRPRSHLILL